MKLQLWNEFEFIIFGSKFIQIFEENVLLMTDLS